MAPHGDNMSTRTNFIKPSRLSTEGLQRTISDISFELTKQELTSLAPISEIEDARCECCGMSEECTPEYIENVRSKYSGKWICGLCSEAVKEEMEKNKGMKLEDALHAHMSACARFNKFGRAYTVLNQAEPMRQLLKRSRAKSLSPKGIGGGALLKGAIGRSSSCMSAITREINDMTLINKVTN